MTDSIRELFDTLAKVLLRSFVLGFALLSLWAGTYVLAGGVIYGVHGRMFGLTPHEVDVIHYCGIAFPGELDRCHQTIPTS
jgi:hypothetical protein